MLVCLLPEISLASFRIPDSIPPTTTATHIVHVLLAFHPFPPSPSAYPILPAMANLLKCPLMRKLFALYCIWLGAIFGKRHYSDPVISWLDLITFVCLGSTGSSCRRVPEAVLHRHTYTLSVLSLQCRCRHLGASKKQLYSFYPATKPEVVLIQRMCMGHNIMTDEIRTSIITKSFMVSLVRKKPKWSRWLRWDFVWGG